MMIDPLAEFNKNAESVFPREPLRPPRTCDIHAPPPLVVDSVWDPAEISITRSVPQPRPPRRSVATQGTILFLRRIKDHCLDTEENDLSLADGEPPVCLPSLQL